MIGRDELYEAARYLDAQSDEGLTLPEITKGLDVEQDGLDATAEQRANRLAMLLDGQDPRKLSKTEVTHVKISADIARLIPLFMSIWLDGCSVGLRAEQTRQRSNDED